MSADHRSSLTRRQLVLGAGAIAAGGGVVAVAGRDSAPGSAAPARDVPEVELGVQPAGLPSRQHAWGATLRVDSDGNTVVPTADRLLLFDVEGTPSSRGARLLEASLRTLERRFSWGPSGLLFTVGWGPGYFEDVLRLHSPIPRAKGLSDFEIPTIDDYHVCVHLACDDARRLADVEGALVHGEAWPGADGPVDVSTVLRWRETRTGFVGAGLPHANQDVGGIPRGDHVPPTSPLYMGFKSNFARNQATEDDVTIETGPLAGGTTQHVSYMRLRLASWYEGLSYRERVQLMYSPQTTPDDVAHFTDNPPTHTAGLNEAINHYGVIGHSQCSARARRNGRPLIIRRDFDSTDGGQAGLHFVAIQRTIEDFITTRTAMNASDAQLQNPAITDTQNNGINAFIFVLRRANYVLPPRPSRSFPLLPGVDLPRAPV